MFVILLFNSKCNILVTLVRNRDGFFNVSILLIISIVLYGVFYSYNLRECIMMNHDSESVFVLYACC